MKISEEFRASRSVVVDVRRWQDEISQSIIRLKEALSTLGELVRQSVNNDRIAFEEFQRTFSDFDELVESVRNELYSLEEVIEQINGCEICEGEEPTKVAKLVAKELKVLKIFQQVGESYAKARSLHIQFGKGSEMIPKNDLLSALADLGKAEQNMRDEIKDLTSTLESIYKQAEQLGEQKVA
ncbi:MAG: hypothetical protein ACXACI_00260 [Candidatus Hodarchaeales archaeon]